MATTQTTYTGNGSTTNYSFTFEYIKQSDVKVTLDTVATTAFTFANATTLVFTTAPANNVAIRIYRDTNIDTLNATFFPGSAIKAQDLNNNFTQSHFTAQETDAELVIANTAAASAVTTADSALAKAISAETTANSADANATIALNNSRESDGSGGFKSAIDKATDAVTTANAADADATTALTNSRESDGSGGFITAIAKANTAITTANIADGNATIALNNSRESDGSGGFTSAITKATDAVNTANAASTAVANAVFYSPIANVAAIPGSPSNNDYVEVQNSTGIESFTPLANLPSGFIGVAGLTVRLQYTSTGSTWNFQNYFANDSETRYLTKNAPVVTGDSTNGSGQITLNCENNSHGIKIKGPPHSAGANYTLTLPNDTGTSGQLLTTNGSGVLSFADSITSITTQPDFDYATGGDSFTLNDGLSQSPTSNSSEFSFFCSGQNGDFYFMPTNASIKADMEDLQLGDSVTLDWTLPNGTTASQTTTVNTRTAQPIPSGSHGKVTFTNAPSYHSSNASTVKLTSSRFSRGAAAIANNQILRYKTATSKWTVDNADATFIETPQAITVDKVIAASTNAGMMGPTVAINSGISISVGANSLLTVLK